MKPLLCAGIAEARSTSSLEQADVHADAIAGALFVSASEPAARTEAGAMVALESLALFSAWA